MKCAPHLPVLLASFLGMLATPASAVVIDFEGLPDLTPVGATYSGLGVTFANATAVMAGASLNQFEFPPHSGTKVAFDDAGPITGTFSTPVTTVSFYATYADRLQFTIFNAGSTQVGLVNSLHLANYTSSGNPPNELLQLSYAPGIVSFRIEGDPLGNSFVIDDFTFTAGMTPQVPDHNAVPPMALAGLLAVLLALARRFGNRAAASRG